MRGTRYTVVPNFVRALQEEQILQVHALKAKNGKTISLYGSYPLRDLSPCQVATAMFPDGYFCNLTSIYFHSLTKQIPNVVYICHETITPKRRRDSDIPSDTRLRNAFIKPHRYTTYVVEFEGHEIVVIDREKGSDHGVVEVRKRGAACPQGSRVTCLERALIDAVVAPHYNGGIASLCAYFRAAQKRLRIERLLEICRKLDFVYPYAQSIGFFLDRSGLQKQAAEMRRTFPPQRQFFVDHDAKSSWEYDDQWMLFYPKGLVDEG
jgi:predicted transcriptional regulator of viral defense system